MRRRLTHAVVTMKVVAALMRSAARKRLCDRADTAAASLNDFDRRSRRWARRRFLNEASAAAEARFRFLSRGDVSAFRRRAAKF
jgi:hypothetical protein